MNAAALLDRIADAGAAASLGPDGRVRIAGVSRLPAGLLDLLRENRDGIAAALAARSANAGAGSAAEPDPEDAAEQAAMAEHYAAPADPGAWRPGDPDPLADGLLYGRLWAGRRARLASLSGRLWVARPKRVHGVRQLDWQAMEAAAREAAGLPSAAWAAWRAAAGTEARR